MGRFFQKSAGRGVDVGARPASADGLAVAGEAAPAVGEGGRGEGDENAAVD